MQKAAILRRLLVLGSLRLAGPFVAPVDLSDARLCEFGIQPEVRSLRLRKI